MQVRSAEWTQVACSRWLDVTPCAGHHQSMSSDNRAPFELSSRLRDVRRWMSLALLATVIIQVLGSSYFDKGVGLGIAIALAGIIAAITAYDFVKLGRRRTPSRW